MPFPGTVRFREVPLTALPSIHLPPHRWGHLLSWALKKEDLHLGGGGVKYLYTVDTFTDWYIINFQSTIKIFWEPDHRKPQLPSGRQSSDYNNNNTVATLSALPSNPRSLHLVDTKWRFQKYHCQLSLCMKSWIALIVSKYRSPAGPHCSGTRDNITALCSDEFWDEAINWAAV